MHDTLDIHRANPAELVQAHRNTHDIWSRGLSLDAHVKRRLELPLHQRAWWYVGTIDGQVVTSLGIYPLSFRVNQKTVPAGAIGSVYTRREWRGRGFAPRLIDWGERDIYRQGARLSILFSDIDPAYYARLGYIRCQTMSGWQSAGPVANSDDEGWRLEPCDPAHELDQWSELYLSDHGRQVLHVERDREYWNHLVVRRADDRMYLLSDPQGRVQGYCRLTPLFAGPAGLTPLVPSPERQGVQPRWSAAKISDYALAGPYDDKQYEPKLARLYRLVSVEAAAHGAERFGGWLPDCPAARSLFELVDRQDEITMIKSLSPELAVEESWIEAAGRMPEIEHV